jgi:hypothetical protein
VRAVDTHRLETGQPAAAAIAETGRGARDLVSDASGRTLYVPFVGADIEGVTGGVAVIEVSQEPCAGLFEKALEGCPTCPDESSRGWSTRSSTNCCARWGASSGPIRR